ncbi:copper chaperone PCu(A)C [Parasphingopyxis algicola]|uniref:copper chaperone PCu(A)C n=1 Tax=Parasphingopyxis algicola TaxID=2026624 RepID=UPI0015A4C0B8|nr:copper chaperone PCu(A)C [Parasphingopyxis algicola]QLC23743.1 copper chaperone PCu(A)C [Parasphingopyxis algicola]
MRFPFIAVLATTALVACSPAEEAGPVEMVENAWVRLPAVDGRPAAAYFVLNGGEGGDTLLAIDSERVATVELHETIMEDGAMRMRPIMSADVPPGEAIVFEPGGRHGMLFGVDPEITPGTPLTLNFRFDSGRDVSVDAVTIAAGDSPPFEGGGETDHGAH